MRLTRIDSEDLNLFEFDYDLTLMMFFMDAEERVYARYGGRDADDADHRQSLAGLRYTMQAVLDAHGAASKEFAPRSEGGSKRVREIQGDPRGRRERGGKGGHDCMHCHQVKESLQRNLERTGKWSREMIWRFPLPQTLGFDVELDRGNVVKEVKAGSPGAKAGLAAGDVLRRVGDIPTHSFGDVQFALDRAPVRGEIDVTWTRAQQSKTARIALGEGWRKSDVSWRPSAQHMLPAARLDGVDLGAEEKKALGLAPEQLAFRQEARIRPQAEAAGIREGDIVIGLDDLRLDMNSTQFQHFVRRSYLIGDRVKVNLFRDGKRMALEMELRR